MSTIIKRSFVGGELAPAVQSRVDTIKYEFGLKTCRNALVMRHGGVQNRPGTKLVGEIFVDGSPTFGPAIRTIPFIVDQSNSYVLEFRTRKAPFFAAGACMRVIKNGAYVSTSILDILTVSKSNPAIVTTSAPHGIVTGQEVFISGCVGMEELNFRDLRVVVTGVSTFTLQNMDGTTFDSTNFSTYLFGGKSACIYETLATGILLTSLNEKNLKFVQNANSMIVVGAQDGVNPYFQQPTEIKRINDTNWTFTTMTFAPTQAPPTGVVASSFTPGLIPYRFVMTAINDITGEESLPTAVATTLGVDPVTSTNWNQLGFTPALGATEYNVYKETPRGSGYYLLLGVTRTTFLDVGQAVTNQQPPAVSNNFTGTNNYPTCVTFFQQRLLFGNTIANPERIFGSRIGLQNNFVSSRQLNDDDALQFDMTANQVNKIQNMINIGKLIVFTTGSENSIEGNSNGTLTPTAVNPKQYSQNGSSIVPPLVVGGDALYIQNRGSIVRSLAFEFQSDSYRGNDLTIYASHLFVGRTIVEWAWQQIPQSIVWCVLDNGNVIALTYIREQQIWAWHRHDTDGFVRHICSIPEGEEDAIYVVVERVINGSTHFFSERLNTRIVSDDTIDDAVFSDCLLTIDNRNSDPAAQVDVINSALVVNADPPGNIIAINSPTWLAGVPLQMRFIGLQFPLPPLRRFNIGDVIQITDSSGFELTMTITFLSTLSGEFVAVPDRDVPVSMQSLVTAPLRFSSWKRLVKKFVGFWHLEGENVSVLADGAVVASPNNPKYPVVKVVNGTINLDFPAAVIQVGLPYITDIETLNIDITQGETMIDKAKNVERVTIALEDTRGGFYGPEIPTGSDPTEGLFELKTRNQETYGSNPDLTTGTAYVNLRTEWNSNGRILIRQTDPLPMSVLAVAPGGFIPTRQ